MCFDLAEERNPVKKHEPQVHDQRMQFCGLFAFVYANNLHAFCKTVCARFEYCVVMPFSQDGGPKLAHLGAKVGSEMIPKWAKSGPWRAAARTGPVGWRRSMMSE